MKKRILVALIMFLVTIGCSDLLFSNTANASSTTVTPTAYQISISSYPIKTVYASGEKLDLEGLRVESYYMDGTINEIKDYTAEGFRSNVVGVQTVYLHYQNCTASFQITVQPAKVTNINVKSHSTTSYTLGWDAAEDVSYYEIYSMDAITGTYLLAATTTENSYTFQPLDKAVKSYQIRTVRNLNGIIYTGEFSDPFTAATSPEAVTSLTVINSSADSVELSWSAVNGASGYRIYRKTSTASDYLYCGTTTSTSYIDTYLNSGTSYQYKVCAYHYSEAFTGAFSPIVDISTNPAKVVLKSKSGDKKIRLTWSKVTGATSYDIYTEDSAGNFILQKTNQGNTNCTYIFEGLANDETYSFYVIAKRVYLDQVYESPQSDVLSTTVGMVSDTSTVAKYFSDETAFQTSNAYNKIPFFKNNVDYSKSYIIPGLITTNVGGFSSSTMCPQGITFAKGYLLISAYDLSDEENSVVYVLNKKSKELLTTLVLPTDAHVGGICFDGKYIWLTTGSKVSCFPFSDVTAAVKSKEPFSNISFLSVCKVGIATSYITYYNDKLWVGSYDELKTTYMYSYSIDDFDTMVELTKEDTIKMPTRVQGIAFTENGYLILSRSCQLYKGLRGYMRRLDVYQPDFFDEDAVTKSLGSCLTHVYTPSMNEGIAIDGSNLFVIFESAAFANASYTVDRVCAFDLEALLGGIPDLTFNAK